VPSRGKQLLYAAIYDALAPGGSFFNLDGARPVEDELREVYRAAGGRPARSRPDEERARLSSHYFETLDEQLDLLRGAGFRLVDCFWKCLDQVLADRRPEPADLPRLTYTSMVANEALRLYPPAWAIVRAAIRPTRVGGRPLTWTSVGAGTTGIDRSATVTTLTLSDELAGISTVLSWVAVTLKLTVALAPGASDGSWQKTSVPLPPPPMLVHSAPVAVSPLNLTPLGVEEPSDPVATFPEVFVTTIEIGEATPSLRLSGPVIVMLKAPVALTVAAWTGRMAARLSPATASSEPTTRRAKPEYRGERVRSELAR
jgi:cytochrome P450